MRLSKELWEKDYVTESHEVIILFKYAFYNLGFVLKCGFVGKFLGQNKESKKLEYKNETV